MTGLSGSGKSTTAGALAAQSGAIRLRSDAVRKHLAGVPLHEKGGNEIYTPEMSDRTYTRLIELGVRLASQGYHAILDAKFDRTAKRQEALAAAQANDIELMFLHCTAPAEVLEARVRQRSGDIADADVAILAQQSMEPFAEMTPVTVLDTTRPEDSMREQLTSLFK